MVAELSLGGRLALLGHGVHARVAREREVEPFGGDHREREDEWDKLSVHKKTGEGASSVGSSDHGLRAWARLWRARSRAWRGNTRGRSSGAATEANGGSRTAAML